MNTIEKNLLHTVKNRILMRLDNDDIAPHETVHLAHAYATLCTVPIVTEVTILEGSDYEG